MSRGPTIRFRVYAWRYAAILWSQQPFAGSGAGQYPCQANFYAALTDDRVLDPAAFPAEMVEHAHNELFEVFAEIGLVGGVTFVAGLLATLAAASALLRTSLSPERRWLLYGLVAAVIALLADAMFGVGLRLPGLPAVFYTLLGVLWAACRSVSKQRSTEASVSDVWLRRMVVRRYGLAAVALLSAALATRAMLRNWTGVRAEWSGQAAQRAGQWEAALASTRLAEARLLDPVRKLIANMHAVDCEFARARGNFGQAAAALAERDAVHPEGDGTSSTPAAAPELLRAAVSDCRAAYDAAFALSRRAPNLGRMAAVGAQCAEMLATMYSRVGDSKQAGVWGIRALQAWRSQRALRSFDVQTLLALTRYPALTGDYIGLLRDTLRAGFPPREWYGALQSRTRTRDFEQTLAAMIQAVGPYNPQTELNTLIISRKPEMYRLSGAWKALRGDYESAASDAARAARLYEPMRPRFPELYSVVLAEQAEYMLGAHPEEPGRAAALLREAIRALPAMQSQKYAEMAAPYRLRLARVLAEMSAADEAATLLQTVLDVWPADRTAWGLTVGMAVRRGDAGLPARDLEHIRQVVRERMPEAFETRRDE
jgi:tetratricopeptide (TPR) repeat protein